MTASTFAAAVAVETRKTTAARVVLSTTVLLIAGVAMLSAASTLAAESGNAQIVAKLGPLAAAGGWAALLGTASQISGAAGLLAFGVVLSWIYGREFADGTITGLFGLPVSRPTLALAKLVVYLLWSLIVSAVLVLVVTGVGLATGMGWPDGEAAAALGRLAALVPLTGLLAVPAAWASTIGRGLLPGIATTVVSIAISQVMVVAGTGGWFPFAAPTLWAIMPGMVGPTQLALVVVVPVVFGGLALASWGRLQLDR
jgi:ABC-2 type transport system permease protein